MKVLVIGESCADISHYGRCDRLSPEGPIPVFLPQETQQKAGMAANVMANIQSLRPDVEVKLITSQFTPIKRRFVDNVSGYILLRCDEQDHIPDKINYNDEIEQLIEQSDAVVVSDYNKGFLPVPAIRKISTVAKEYGKPSFLDTKKEGGLWAGNFDFIKVNEKEFNNHWSSWACKSSVLYSHIIKTLGDRGCEYQNKIYPAKPVSLRDPTGAGDTFLAAFVVKYLETQSAEQSIEFAQDCCKVVVQKLGTTVVDPSEL